MQHLTRMEGKLVDLLQDGVVRPVSVLCLDLDVDPNALRQLVFRTRKKMPLNYDIVYVNHGDTRGYRLLRTLATSSE